MLVSYSSSSRLGLVLLPIIQILLSSLAAAQEYLLLAVAAAGAELLDCSVVCSVYSLRCSSSIGEGRAPPELLLGAPPTVLTAAAGAATAGAAPHPAVSGGGLLVAFLSKNIVMLPPSSP